MKPLPALGSTVKLTFGCPGAVVQEEYEVVGHVSDDRVDLRAKGFTGSVGTPLHWVQGYEHTKTSPTVVLRATPLHDPHRTQD